MKLLAFIWLMLAHLFFLPAGSVYAQKSSLVVGYLATPALMGHFVADYSNYFREEGLDVLSVLFRGGVQVAQSVISGDAHIGLASPPELITGINAGARIKGVWGTSNLMPFALISRPNIRTVKDLKGKKLAVSSRGALSDFLTQHTLKQHGLDPSRDVTILAVGGVPTRFAAILAGAVDASLISAAHFAKAKREGLNFLVMLSDVIREWPLDLAYVREDFIAKRDRDLRAYLRAYSRGVITAKADREVSIKSIQKILRYDRESAAEGYDYYVKSIPEDGRIAEKGMDLLMDQLLESGAIKRRYAMSELIDYRYIGAAQRR